MSRSKITKDRKFIIIVCLFLLGMAIPDSGQAKGIISRFSGKVSWYGPGFQGKKTANGERFNTNDFTCASKSLPFGTRILIENPKNGKSVIVRVNDRGPYAKGRVLDLSRAAAKKIGILLGGTAFVDCTVLKGLHKVESLGTRQLKKGTDKLKRGVRKIRFIPKHK